MEQSITASTSSNNFNGSNDFQMGELKLNEVTSKNPAKKKRKQVSKFHSIHSKLCASQEERLFECTNFKRIADDLDLSHFLF